MQKLQEIGCREAVSLNLTRHAHQPKEDIPRKDKQQQAPENRRKNNGDDLRHIWLIVIHKVSSPREMSVESASLPDAGIS
jgi:hypothetical protein